MSASLASVLEDVAGPNDEQIGVKTWLDTGFPPLNLALSASYSDGLPVGRIVEMFGPESCGKTAIATRAMIAAQQAGGLAIFEDHEHAFDPSLAEELGLDLENQWVYKAPETFEQSTTRVSKIIREVRDNNAIAPEAPIIAVFDSLASMIPQSKFAKDIDEQGMNDSLALAKACSAVFPTLAGLARKYNTLMLFLNQEREKPGVMFGPNLTTPGGRAPKFYASVRIQLARTQLTEGKGREQKFLGQEIYANVVKNKVAPPFKKAVWRFMFREDGTGYFDVTTSLIDYLIEIGVIKKKGSRIEWGGKSHFKSQVVELIDKNGLQDKLFELLPKS